MQELIANTDAIGNFRRLLLHKTCCRAPRRPGQAVGDALLRETVFALENILRCRALSRKRHGG